MIVADASWIISLRDPTDRHHVEASAVNEATSDESILLHPLTFAECLVAPANLGLVDTAAADLRAAFEITGQDEDAPVRWATLRATTGLRLPDVVVLDTALHHGARGLVTFDGRLAGRAISEGLDVLGATTA